MNKLILFIIVIFSLISVNSIFAQHIDSTEINSSVPELYKFHDVIYVIWHEAYPAKDVKALKGMTEDIKMHLDKINNAVLPGILKDKKSKWEEGLKVLNESANNYYTAAAGDNEQAMLDAAEKLHSNFEMMVRILKPINKEVDDFHKDLYVIFHKYYPAKDYKGVESLIDNMIVKADLISASKLTKRLEAKTDDFQKIAKELKEKAIALKEVLKSNDGAAIDKAIDAMHSKYQDLEKIFD